MTNSISSIDRKSLARELRTLLNDRACVPPLRWIAQLIIAQIRNYDRLLALPSSADIDEAKKQIEIGFADSVKELHAHITPPREAA